MQKLLLTIIIAITFLSVLGQGKVLEPGAEYINSTNDTLFVLPAKQVKSLLSDAISNDLNLERLKLYKEKLVVIEDRIALADSATQLKNLEAEYWRQQLLTHDQTLETQRIENMKLIDDKNRIRKSRIYYLAAGFVAGIFLSSQ